jgi:hypothetical protein
MPQLLVLVTAFVVALLTATLGVAVAQAYPGVTGDGDIDPDRHAGHSG